MLFSKPTLPARDDILRSHAGRHRFTSGFWRVLKAGDDERGSIDSGAQTNAVGCIVAVRRACPGRARYGWTDVRHN